MTITKGQYAYEAVHRFGEGLTKGEYMGFGQTALEAINMCMSKMGLITTTAEDMDDDSDHEDVRLFTNEREY